MKAGALSLIAACLFAATGARADIPVGGLDNLVFAGNCHLDRGAAQWFSLPVNAGTKIAITETDGFGVCGERLANEPSPALLELVQRLVLPRGLANDLWDERTYWANVMPHLLLTLMLTPQHHRGDPAPPRTQVRLSVRVSVTYRFRRGVSSVG
jgi:hypothetical protein